MVDGGVPWFSWNGSPEFVSRTVVTVVDVLLGFVHTEIKGSVRVLRKTQGSRMELEGGQGGDGAHRNRRRTSMAVADCEVPGGTAWRRSWISEWGE